MKSTTQIPKATPSTSFSSKSKKSGSKEREKRKSQSGFLDTCLLNEIESSNKENGVRQYAGIGPDSIYIYAEQSCNETLTEDVCNILSEDINSKLRYIIHDSLLKARMCGRNKINHKDIDATFENLNIEKIYGATSNPNWVPLADQNVLYLDDTKINLVEIAEEETEYVQQGTVKVEKKWFPEEISPNLKKYFVTVCQSIVSTDSDLRKMALEDVSQNCHIGPIIGWFYNFGNLLLSKDIPDDSLTLRGLELIETLENSPLGSQNVTEGQLKLLVRLLLERLLNSVTNVKVLKPMCSVLATLCLRSPLREFVIQKINHKMPSICHNYALPILLIINYLGVKAVSDIFLPTSNFFLSKALKQQDSDIIFALLGIYNIMCRAELNYISVHKYFSEIFGTTLVMFWRPLCHQKEEDNTKEVNLVKMKVDLIKTRRKVTPIVSKRKHNIGDVFQLPQGVCEISKILDAQKFIHRQYNKESHVVIGKTSLKLSVLKYTKPLKRSKCCDHSLLSYNI